MFATEKSTADYNKKTILFKEYTEEIINVHDRD